MNRRSWMLGNAFGLGAAAVGLRGREMLFSNDALPSDEQPMIWPIPREVRKRSGRLKVDESVVILVPENPSHSDLFLASFLSAELADEFGVPLRIQRVAAIPKEKRFILMGSASEPLVREYCAAHDISISSSNPGAEGYVLDANDQAAAILGSDEAGAFYGLQTLRQILDRSDEALSIRAQQIIDWPYKPFRGVHVYLPCRQQIPFFKRYVREIAAFYKINKLIVEVSATMQFERHPELNAGWIDFIKDMAYTRRISSAGPGGQAQDGPSVGCYVGSMLEKSTVSELVQYCRQYYVDVIPLIPTLTHCYHLLTRHRELAAIQDAEWPDTYYPLPETYKLVFDVMDEYIEVMKPRMVHIGHDEWRIPWELCSRCQGQDPTVMFARDVNKLYSYLKGRNVEVAMWADYLLERVRGKRFRQHPSPSGVPYMVPGALSPQQVRQTIPKDILMFNWFWGYPRNDGEANDIELEDFGFQQVYGNLTPEIQDYGRRSHRKSVIGGAPSSWVATTEFDFGKDRMYNLLGCANLVWSTHWLNTKNVSERVQKAVPGIRRRVAQHLCPSNDNPTVPVDIRAYMNAPVGNSHFHGIDLSLLRTGKVIVGTKMFDLTNPDENDGKNAIFILTGQQQTESGAVASIPIQEDVSSVVLLHACSRPAQFFQGYDEGWGDDADTADLLGYYQFVYEDGFVDIAPVRYGVNILEAGWGKTHDPQNVAYQAELIDCGKLSAEPMTFFAFEWVSPRFGKPLKEVHLKGISGFRDYRGELIPNNSIILLAVSVVKKRPPLLPQFRARRSPWSRPSSSTM